MIHFDKVYEQETSVINVVQCCQEQNVTSTCLDACTQFLDIESVIDRPECIGDFHKLMRCAAGQLIWILKLNRIFSHLEQH